MQWIVFSRPFGSHQVILVAPARLGRLDGPIAHNLLRFVDETHTAGRQATLNSNPGAPIASRGHTGKAQAMVEFALALPIFLLVIYGLLETGRLIFLYSSVITSSREAVRYASGAGIISSTSTTYQYQDCAGIRAAAKNTGFLLNLQDSQIRIYYDKPLGSPVVPLTEYCTPGNATDTSVQLKSGVGYRLLVSVSAPYSLAVPLVPFTPQTISSGLTARTYMGVIDLIPTATPGP